MRLILPDGEPCTPLLRKKKGTLMKKIDLTRREFLAGTSAGLAAASATSSAAASPHALGLGRGAPASSGVRVAVFSCDITPPVGSPLEECDPPVATSIDIPLLAKGIILADDRTRYALCGLDYCELRAGAHDLVRRKLANALGVNELQIEVHCLHQHDAPLYDTTADMLSDLVPSPPYVGVPAFLESVSDRIAAAAGDALKHLEPCTHVGVGKAKVEKFASNRRVPMPDGSIGIRLSHCNDPVLIAAPEGLIDPWVRTISFFSHDHPIVRLHYYATHPQSYYGKGHINPDTVGLAREHMEKEEGIPQIYFTGCCGNVAAGKYNDGSPPLRGILADRLQQGMRGAIAATRKEKLTEIRWKTADVRFALRTEPNFSEGHFREVIFDAQQPYHQRTHAAIGLSWYERLKVRPTVDISCYRLGPAWILHLPGEAFVEYQLYAESLRPNDFLATAAYGELGTGYICLDKSAAEGGYEPTASYVGPPSEERLKAAIQEVLG